MISVKLWEKRFCHVILQVHFFGVKATVAPLVSSGIGISLREAGHASIGLVNNTLCTSLSL